MLSLQQLIHDASRANYKLDMLSVAGLLGGDNAVDALETIHLYEGRRWAGWYNYPGTVGVAKRFGQMANSPLWDSAFPGPNETPATTFRLAGKSGPEYSGSLSGTKLRTGYLGYLIAQNSLSTDATPKERVAIRQNGDLRKSPVTVVIISLPPRQKDKKDQSGFIRINPKSKSYPLALCSIVPSLVSIGAGVLCVIAHDPFCTSLIYLGVFCSGFSSLVLGTASLGIRVPVPSPNSPPGDGLMFPDDGGLVVLKGAEEDVNVVTKGEFDLDYSEGILPDKKKKYHTIGLSSVLLYLQFLIQLLLVPRCTLFGQILFLISWATSAGYHVFMASRKSENLHWELLSRELSAKVRKWTLRTKVQMAVFACLALGDGHKDPQRSNPEAMLNRIIPDDKAVWRYWKKKVLKELGHFWISGSPAPYFPSIHVAPTSGDEEEAEVYALLTDSDKKLLVDFVGDAWYVFNKYESKIWERDDAAGENSKACLL